MVFYQYHNYDIAPMLYDISTIMLDHTIYYILYIEFMCMHSIIFIWIRGGGEINTGIIQQHNYSFIKIYISANT